MRGLETTMQRSAALALALCLTGQIDGTAGAEGIERIETLTGGDSREWVLTGGGVILNDQAGRCTDGETWVFREDGTGSKLVCEEGNHVEGRFGWSIENGSGDGRLLMIDDQHYLLDFRQVPSDLAGEPSILMIILREPRIDQVTPVREIRLEHWER